MKKRHKLCEVCLIGNERGQALLEYTMLLALVGLVFIVAATTLEEALMGYLSRIFKAVSRPLP